MADPDLPGGQGSSPLPQTGPGGDPPGGAGPSRPPRTAGFAGVDAPTQYDVVLEPRRRADVVLPAVLLMLNEDRSGGWSGAVRLNPRRAAAEDALQDIMGNGLVPGAAATIKLVIAGRTGHGGTVVRTWPSVVTSVNAASDDADALCAVTFRDPVTYLRNRPIWAAFAACSPGSLVGGALSAAAGGDGKATRDPVLPGMPPVRIREQLRAGIAEVPYALAVGEPLGYWLNRVCGRLGVRLEMLGDPDGAFELSLTDRAPAQTVLNLDGGIEMAFYPDLPPSALNLNMAGLAVGRPLPGRGGILDNLVGGGAVAFGPRGALESVFMESGLSLEEAEHRSTFRPATSSLGQVRAAFRSSQPGLLPGRVINLIGSESTPTTAGERAPFGGHGSLLGARRWQVADVSHLCVNARYWNSATFEKTGTPWRPAAPEDDEGAVFISGVVDDGNSEPGAVVARDRLGRVPVRVSFADGIPEQPESTPSSGDPQAQPAPKPTTVPLAQVEPGAGKLHGFVSDHRQGDPCRVEVINPLYAEIVGFSHRDDRFLSARVRDATVGIVLGEDEDEWRGILFRPEEAIEEEIESAADTDESPSDSE